MSYRCRFCSAALERTFCDLGVSPLANAYLQREQLDEPEVHYPLHVRVCSACLLVQLPELRSPAEIFSDYAYFSSYSSSWLEHCRRYAAMASARFGLGADSQVVEVASNDGYLLRFFRELGVPVLGIEPARNVAAATQAAGIDTWVRFFDHALAGELAAVGRQADLLVANNVLAHVPALNDFVAGLKLALKPSGVLTVEFPHLLQLVAHNQFDTIYHEHVSYFSFATALRILESHELAVFDVEELPTHGGSLRVFASHPGAHAVAARVGALLRCEKEAGLTELATYERFAEVPARVKGALLDFLIDARRRGRRVAAYGAPAKGNTLLNFCGVRADMVDFTVDASPHKQGRYLPGSRIPVYEPARIYEKKPDYLLILPWNLREEITRQLEDVARWGCRFALPIPELTVLP